MDRIKMIAQQIVVRWGGENVTMVVIVVVVAILSIAAVIEAAL